MRKGTFLALSVCLGFIIGAMGPALAQRRQLSLLDQLSKGKWEFRLRGDRNQVEKLCVTDGRALLRIRHQNVSCEQLIIEDSADSVTVQYTCPGRGYGRTHIRRETNMLIQLETQGVAAGLPFDFSAEGRRTGECA